MSSIQELEKEFGKKQSKALRKALMLLKKQARMKAAELKALRARNDRLARALLTKYYDKTQPAGKKWTSKEAQRRFRLIMSRRHKLHERIAKLVPEKVEPEFDSP